MKPEIEIACFNLESLSIAQSGGADRIEFCADYAVGGVSPKPEDIKTARKLCRLPLHVIVRPRPGDFCYSMSEIEEMRRVIAVCKNAGIDGVVFGLLDSERAVNLEKNRELIQLSRPMKVCFHRAIDDSQNPGKELDKLIDLGVDLVLTSGGKENVEEGMEQLSLWQKEKGDQIVIMPGGSLRSSNLKQVLDRTQCRAFHSSAITGLTVLPDLEEIERMVNILKSR